ncbi:MAG: TldD/PmbA family protein, partial [Anaerolineae bacterium]|nr:TldD/PmbA family protein [Anaerolineae bacterium]
GADQGAGIRLFFGDLVTYAYTDDLSEASLLRAAEAARAAGNANQGLRMIDLTEQKSPLHYPIEKAFDTLSISDKAAILGRVDQVARGYDARVRQVRAGYTEERRHVWIYNSDGIAVEDDRYFVEFRVAAMAQNGQLIQTANEGFGGQLGLELFDRHDPIALAQRISETAVQLLDARPAPAGEMTVVVCNGWGGVLFHEACGHQMEADFITKGTSAYAGRIGELVANPIVNAYDDGTLPGRRGSMRFDDEGTPAARNPLIENGKLIDYMWDLTEARRAKRRSTGNGRRESFRHLPMPRMTNTYIDAGPHDPQEIIASVQKGIYIKSMAGGQADIARGDYVFNATEAYLIEDGKLTAPVRGATIAGNGPKTLMQIDMVGNDLALDPGQGMCGKGQVARVSVGQPTVRIPVAMVGGTGN